MEGDSPKREERSRDLAPHSESPSALVVLHVEDNPDDLALFQEALRQTHLPMECVSVDSAAKAIAHLESLLQQRAVEHTIWPDLVLLDWAMVGQSGATVLQHIRASAAWQRLPVIVFTGDLHPRAADEAYGLGANSCLHKPLRFDRMVEVTQALYQAWALAARPRPPAADQ